MTRPDARALIAAHAALLADYLQLEAQYAEAVIALPALATAAGALRERLHALPPAAAFAEDPGLAGHAPTITAGLHALRDCQDRLAALLQGQRQALRTSGQREHQTLKALQAYGGRAAARPRFHDKRG